MKIVELMLVDDKNQHGLFGLCVGADGTHLGATVVKLPRDFGDESLFMVGNDGEFVGGFGALEQLIAHKGGDEAIEDAQRNGLIVQIPLGVDEQGYARHNAVENKGDDKEIGVGIDFVDVARDDVGAAGGGIVTETHTVDKAADDTAEDDGIDGVVTFGVILDKGEVGALQKQKGERIHHRE